MLAALGDGVADVLEVGQRVVAPTRFGGYAELVSALADGVVPLPERMSFEEGAAVPIAYATAWEALIRAANLHRGERVLIQAAAGGVGIAATQIAKRAGAEVWGTASPGKHDAIRGFGVDHPLDYTRAGLGANRAEARRGHGRDRRRQLPSQLQVAAGRAEGSSASALRAWSRVRTGTSSPPLGQRSACRGSA